MKTEPILLVHATRYGSTKEVAEAIATEMRKTGSTVVAGISDTTGGNIDCG